MTNKTRRLASLLGAASIAALALPAHADEAPAKAQAVDRRAKRPPLWG
jgi:hypothetical protein